MRAKMDAGNRHRHRIQGDAAGGNAQKADVIDNPSTSFNAYTAERDLTVDDQELASIPREIEIRRRRQRRSLHAEGARRRGDAVRSDERANEFGGFVRPYDEKPAAAPRHRIGNGVRRL